MSGDAAETTGLALVKVVEGTPETSAADGTSAAARLWGALAALAALADQAAHRRLGFPKPAIYAIPRRPSYHRAFHDVTHGNNTVIFGRPFTATAPARAGTP